jgi:hypothetical protein
MRLPATKRARVLSERAVRMATIPMRKITMPSR